MDKVSALKELLVRVEVGDADGNNFSDVFGSPCQDMEYEGRVHAAKMAYRGSLDAAKSLHEAVLEGFYWDATHIVRDGVRAHQYFVRRGAVCEWSEHATPARAWLIAILKALIAQHETTS